MSGIQLALNYPKAMQPVLAAMNESQALYATKFLQIFEHCTFTVCDVLRKQGHPKTAVVDTAHCGEDVVVYQLKNVVQVDPWLLGSIEDAIIDILKPRSIVNERNFEDYVSLVFSDGRLNLGFQQRLLWNYNDPHTGFERRRKQRHAKDAGSKGHDKILWHIVIIFTIVMLVGLLYLTCRKIGFNPYETQNGAADEMPWMCAGFWDVWNMFSFTEPLKSPRTAPETLKTPEQPHLEKGVFPKKMN